MKLVRKYFTPSPTFYKYKKKIYIYNHVIDTTLFKYDKYNQKQNLYSQLYYLKKKAK